MPLVWNFRNDDDYIPAQSDLEASQAKRKADSAAESVRQLQVRVERLSMVCQAMWELLREKTKLTDEDIIKQMQKIDLRDGVEDGKMTRQTLVCPECGRNVSSRREQCLYCGTWLVKSNLFE
jgi:ribosomal protein S27AE